jgi:hypothetical protein
MHKILLVGCGELGSRFLQSLLNLKNISKIDIVEPNENAKNIAIKRIVDYEHQIQIIWHKSLTSDIKTGDVALITTHADIRYELFNKVIKIGYKQIILEKVVTQSLSNYIEMLNLTKNNNAKVWVNCKTRAYPIWQYIKSKISSSDRILFNSIGGNHGLCTNGLHTMDLFVFLTSSKELTCLSLNIDKEIHVTKRGKFDMSGDVIFNSSNNSTLKLQYNKEHFGMPLDIITCKDYRWVIDNATKQAFESSINSNNSLEILPFEGNLMVSEMTKDFVNDIFNYGDCKLPTLEECFISHKPIFENYLTLFNTYLKKSDQFCPIT